MPVEIVEFQEDHLDKFVPRTGDDVKALRGLSAYRDFLYAVTAIEEGEILGVGGVCFMGDHDADAFLTLSENAVKKPVRFCLLVKRELRKMIKKFNLHEVRIFIDNHYNIERCGWAIKLGFSQYRGQWPGWSCLVMKVK
jgi:hypothetical protein